MNKQFLIAILVLVLLAIGGFFWYNAGQNKTDNPPAPSSNNNTSQTKSAGFDNPKKSAHYESNTPPHAAVLAGVPVNVVIDFNFDVADGSSISITKNGKEYGVGETLIDSNPLAMRREMDSGAPDGIYKVSYKACWADGSCHDGQFQFAIDKSRAAEFEDMRDKKEVSINLKDTAFNPRNVRISPGTQVTWINMDDDVHTVNTDSHPAHTYFADQNSRNLNKGDTYSVTFEKAGIYLYHCTPHAGIMTGSILVE